MNKIPFTKVAYQTMQQRVAFLLKEKEAVLERLKDAREQGDLSENGAYKYAKFELGNIRRELNRLDHLLSEGEVTTGSSSNEKISFGKTFTIESDTKQMTYLLVSKFESNPAENKLSADSPLGKAVANKKVGDVVTVITPRGDQTYTIVSIT